MDNSSFLEIVKLLLPEVLIEYFELTNHKIKGEELNLEVLEI